MKPGDSEGPVYGQDANDAVRVKHLAYDSDNDDGGDTKSITWADEVEARKDEPVESEAGEQHATVVARLSLPLVALAGLL